METMPYPRFIVLDLKKKHVEDASQDQGETDSYVITGIGKLQIKPCERNFDK